MNHSDTTAISVVRSLADAGSDNTAPTRSCTDSEVRVGRAGCDCSKGQLNMSNIRQLAAAVALLCLGVACVSMAALSYSGRTAELLQGRRMVMGIPISQGCRHPCCERELRLGDDCS